MERKVMRAYDGMRWPIMALVFAWAIGNASNTNRHFLVRFGPAAVLLPFLSMYNNYIGMYGVHKQIDGLLKEVLDSDLADNESKIRAEVSTFL